jgi:hypothetical protein
MYLILQAALGHGGFSASNRNEYQKQKRKMVLRKRMRTALKADNLTDISETIV